MCRYKRKKVITIQRYKELVFNLNVLNFPKFYEILYCICLSKHETLAYADAVQICGYL